MHTYRLREYYDEIIVGDAARWTCRGRCGDPGRCRRAHERSRCPSAVGPGGSGGPARGVPGPIWIVPYRRVRSRATARAPRGRGLGARLGAGGLSRDQLVVARPRGRRLRAAYGLTTYFSSWARSTGPRSVGAVTSDRRTAALAGSAGPGSERRPIAPPAGGPTGSDGSGSGVQRTTRKACPTRPASSARRAGPVSCTRAIARASTASGTGPYWILGSSRAVTVAVALGPVSQTPQSVSPRKAHRAVARVASGPWSGSVTTTAG